MQQHDGQTAPFAVITGMGIASALGTECPAHVDALRAGRDGLKPTSRFPDSPFASSVVGTWPAWDGRVQVDSEFGVKGAKTGFSLAEMATLAAREAWRGAGLDGAHAPNRVALVFGTCFGQGFCEFHEVAERIARDLGITGPCLTISTACSSSTTAVGLARDLLREGRADAVVAGGADILLREVMAGFSSLGVLCKEKCAPFSEPSGVTLGEGAGFVIVEPFERAVARGVQVHAQVFGYGLSADGFHETTPDPSGAGVARAIDGALHDAGWARNEVDYVNAHATGTVTNDRAEWLAIERCLGPRAEPPLASASKSIFGHAQGAAGILELIASLLCMQDAAVPPTLRFAGPRPGCPADPAAGNAPRPHPVKRALKLSAAFGGANAALAYGAVDSSSKSASPTNASVVVRGIGMVGPRGLVRAPSSDDLAATHSGSIRSIDFRELSRVFDPRRLDRSAHLFTSAAALCLQDAKRVLQGNARSRAGLFLAATRMPADSANRCHESIQRHGLTASSAAAFARMSVNAPAGACARALGLLGPTTTVSMGEGSGLLAIALAAEWLSRRTDTDCLVAGSVDECQLDVADATEGALCVLLDRMPFAEKPGSYIEIGGLGIAGPNEMQSAARQAMGDRESVDAVISDGELAKECLAPEIPDASRLPRGFVDVSRIWGTAEASRSSLAFALGCAWIREGAAKSVLVTTSRSTSASVALLLLANEETV